MEVDSGTGDSASAERCDVVILGAGVGGMTAAYELRDRDIVVLEAEDRVGGRTLSGGDDQAWYNLGAQVISSQRMAAICRELQLDLVSLEHADFGFVVNGQFSHGSTPTALLWRLNLSFAKRLDFGLCSLRLRRQLRSLPKLAAEQRQALDRETLQEMIGRVSTSTQQLLHSCCENSAGIPPDAISSVMGLAYALGAYLDPGAKRHLRGIRGGSQRFAHAIHARLKDGVVRLSSQVQSVESEKDGVRVTYTDAGGRISQLLASHCICALPASAVLRTVKGLPSAKRAALLKLTPYATIITVSWPVVDRRPAPWDGVFFIPVSGSERFGLISNYGYLAKQRHPDLGGYLNTFTHGATAAQFQEVDDQELAEMQHADLLKVFPSAASLLDRSGAVVQRWQDRGLPAMRPGYLSDRPTLRQPVGRILFCGDYTAEPGLSGASGSGHHSAETVLQALGSREPSVA